MIDGLKVLAFCVAMAALVAGVANLEAGRWDLVIWQFATLTWSLLYLFHGRDM